MVSGPSSKTLREGLGMEAIRPSTGPFSQSRHTGPGEERVAPTVHALDRGRLQEDPERRLFGAAGLQQVDGPMEVDLDTLGDRACTGLAVPPRRSSRSRQPTTRSSSDS